MRDRPGLRSRRTSRSVPVDDVNTQVGTLALTWQITKVVRIPVIAAGGIADATGVTAAKVLGAAGAQIGTAYLLCPEATTSAVHRAALKTAEARVTALTNLFTGRPARAIVNRLMREIGPLNNVVPPFPLAAAAMAPVAGRGRKRRARRLLAALGGPERICLPGSARGGADARTCRGRPIGATLLLSILVNCLLHKEIANQYGVNAQGHGARGGRHYALRRVRR